MLYRDEFVQLEKLLYRERNRLVAVTNGMIRGCDLNRRDVVKKEVDGIVEVIAVIHRTVVQGYFALFFAVVQ